MHPNNKEIKNSNIGLWYKISYFTEFRIKRLNISSNKAHREIQSKFCPLKNKSDILHVKHKNITRKWNAKLV